MSRLLAVILAGGRGERLGGIIKANLEVGGMRLLDRVMRALDGANALLVAQGGHAEGEIALPAGAAAIPDLETPYAGPLAGLGAAVAWSLREASVPDLVLTVAVDTPFLPRGFASAMAAAIEPGHNAVVARYGPQDYPTNAVWRLSAIAGLPGEMIAGTAPRSLRQLAASLNAATLTWPDSDGGNPFENVNTPANLKEMERRAEAVDGFSSIAHSVLGNAGQTR